MYQSNVSLRDVLTHVAIFYLSFSALFCLWRYHHRVVENRKLFLSNTFPLEFHRELQYEKHKP